MGWGHLKISRNTGSILTRLGTNHPWEEWFQVCSSKADCPSPRGGNSRRVNIHWKILKIFFSRTWSWTGQNELNLEQIIFGWREFKFVQINGQVLLKREIITNIKTGLGHLKIFLFRTMKPEKLNFTWNLSDLERKQVGENHGPPRVGWGKWKWNAYLILEKYFYMGKDFSGEWCGPWASCLTWSPLLWQCSRVSVQLLRKSCSWPFRSPPLLVHCDIIIWQIQCWK
jgi:hypothetical protein